ncbi:MAG: hypothetical protein ACREMN_02550 [Gemmatimonadales bacterium]
MRTALTLATVIAWPALALAGQGVPHHPLESIGGEGDERARLAQLQGETTAGYLLRTALSRSAALPGDSTRLRWALLTPELRAVWNSSLPFSFNDGALWAGRGWSERVRFGVRAEWGRWFLVLAPELLASENRPYPLASPLTMHARPPDRHPLSSPWHLEPSIDVPLRFGDEGFGRVDPGQSTLGARIGAMAVGISNANEWWGPGIRNAIVVSNHAPGIPRVFVRTTRPLETFAGALEGSWFLGYLSESDYFDSRAANDHRTISGAALVWHPKFAPDLSLGIARSVYARMHDRGDFFGHVFDVVRDRGWRWAPDTGRITSREQILALFGRWVFPADRFAVHFEWARTELPASVRSIFIEPNQSQGYTLGLEWATPVRGGRDLVRFQAEVTSLEKSPNYRNRPVASFYTSGAVEQGYTQRGQVIGAAIGQGASSQWLGLDYFAPSWRVGLSAGRIRWDDDALYTFPIPITSVAPNKWCSHDVSLFATLRAGFQSAWGQLAVALTRGERLNVFFHNLTTCDLHPDPLAIRDARNTTLEVRFSPP